MVYGIAIPTVKDMLGDSKGARNLRGVRKVEIPMARDETPLVFMEHQTSL